MKIKASSLVKFVEDFHLEGKEGTICFDSIVVFTTSKKQVQLPSEVHIVRIEYLGMGLIYLLDPEIAKQGIPDLINNVSSIHYLPKECLYIKGTTIKDGTYVLSIHPTSVNCNPSTLKELYAKTYN